MSDAAQTCGKLNFDLATVTNKLRCNKMALNAMKCSSMFFGLKRGADAPSVMPCRESNRQNLSKAGDAEKNTVKMP